MYQDRKGDEEYPAENVLKDECNSDGLDEWRVMSNDSEFIIVLGCHQDIKAFYIKNGESEYQTENFTVSIATHSKGPWKDVLQGSLNLTTTKVMK